MPSAVPGHQTRVCKRCRFGRRGISRDKRPTIMSSSPASLNQKLTMISPGIT